MKGKKKKRTLRAEIAMMTALTSVSTLLLACVAVIYIFFSYFYENTWEDIRYVLQNTSKQFQSHMQFIEDGAVSVRHNVMLRGFFDGKEYDKEMVKEQLSYGMKLFSDRNTIQRQLPFAISVYLFNSQDDYVYEHYYASTVAFQRLAVEKYCALQQKFKAQEYAYKAYEDQGNINLCFRIYDDAMKEQGICIVEISGSAVEMVLGEVASYQKGSWLLMDNDGEMLYQHGDAGTVGKLYLLGDVWQGKNKIENESMLAYVNPCGFGLRSIVSVGRGNIFTMLKPTALIFGAGLVLVLAAAVFAAFSVSYRFTKPMAGLMENIKAFGSRDFDVRMEEASIREFHDIGTVFNEMAAQIKYLITQVYEKELLATRLQVKYLQAQIDPHFQSNVLAMLALKAKLSGNEELYEGLQAFSGLMQGKIFRSGEMMIRVSEELETVQFYLYLQHSRFRDKISYEICMEDEAVNEDFIPRLLIETLVENAVFHGLEPKAEKGKVTVSLWECDSEGGRMLHICVEDDGVGFEPAEQMPKAEGSAVEEKAGEETAWKLHTHTGLANTKNLLHILYGGRSRMEIDSKKGKGARIEIVLPVKRDRQNVESDSGR